MEFQQSQHYNATNDTGYFKMSRSGRCVQFDDALEHRAIEVSEVRGDQYASVQKGSLIKFIAFLKTLSEQPVTISFDYSGWIKIHEAVYS